MPVIGGTAKYCGICKKETWHALMEGGGCMAKLCIPCYQRRMYPYADRSGRSTQGGMPQLQPEDKAGFNPVYDLQQAVGD